MEKQETGERTLRITKIRRILAPSIAIGSVVFAWATSNPEAGMAGSGTALLGNIIGLHEENEMREDLKQTQRVNGN